VKKLRGVVSMGLLIPAPDDAAIGDDLAGYFGVTHYEPPFPLSAGGEDEKPPTGYRPCYDVDSMRRYSHLFVEGEPVWITEKIHGANARFCFADGAMRAGSRTAWKRQDKSNLWWRALEAHPEVAGFCESHPDITVYGEVYGQVQDLKYGTKQGEVHIAVFDLLRGTEWIAPFEAVRIGKGLPFVPTLESNFPFDLQAVLAMAEGQSYIPGADHLREGIVVKPVKERTDPEIGRVCLKVVSNGYLERV
jgi:RNA ligase (TIGR02306 family)